jgi:hypothetical protein
MEAAQDSSLARVVLDQIRQEKGVVMTFDISTFDVAEFGSSRSGWLRRTIRVIIPKLFRQMLPNDKAAMEAADQCEREGSAAAAAEASKTRGRRRK